MGPIAVLHPCFWLLKVPEATLGEGRQASYQPSDASNPILSKKLQFTQIVKLLHLPCSAKTSSSQVAAIKHALKELSLFNSVRLKWVPGHSNVTGNEIADWLVNLSLEGPK